MDSTRDIFLKQTNLRDRLDAVVKADWFSQCLAYAAAIMMDQPGVTEHHTAGANKFKTILLSMTDEDDLQSAPFPTSGLNYDIDVTERLPKKPEPSKRRKKRS